MAFITATFQNNYSASRKWTIWDTGVDPSAPLVVFDDYLDVNALTPPLQFQQDSGGIQGHAQYQRSDGAPAMVNVSDGDTVLMS
jgi:hypothetical protein